MRFDKIIMNPPYDRSLHLKILRQVMNKADEVVNLSPTALPKLINYLHIF